MKNIKSFLKQCIAEVLVEPTKKLSPRPGKKLVSLVKLCIAEVIVEPVPRKVKIYGNPQRLQATRLIKECVMEVLKENLLTECKNPACERVCCQCKSRFSGTMVCPKCKLDHMKFQVREAFDPTSQGPNMPQENPYPEMNAKMAKLEEDQPKEDSWVRYEKGYAAGQAHKRSGVKPEDKLDSVASVGYYDAITGRDSATPAAVRKTVKEKVVREGSETIYKDREGGQWVYWMNNTDSGGKIRINPASVERYLRQGYRLVTLEPWNDPKTVAGLRKENEHGRYAQQAGAGQFDPDKFGKLDEWGPDEDVITKVKKEVYAALATEGFRPLGDQPRDYVEYYHNGFMTVQVSVGYDSRAARVERYYDSEMVNNMPGHNVVRSFPVPIPYNAVFVQKFIRYAIALKRSGVGDEAIFGGIDDIEESRRTQSVEVEWPCPHCGQTTNIPIEIESPSDYIACADCDHCGKEISDPKLDQQVYAAVINHYAGKANHLKDTSLMEKKKYKPTPNQIEYEKNVERLRHQREIDRYYPPPAKIGLHGKITKTK